MGSEHQTGGHRSTDDVVVGLTGARFGGAAGRRKRAAAPPAEDAGETHQQGDEQPTGARFRPASKRRRPKKGDPELPESSPLNPDGSPDTDSAHTPGVVAAPHQAQPVPAPVTMSQASWAGGAEWVDWSDWEAVGETGGLVRPYFWTGGRTASRYELSFETLISATGQPVDPTAPPEHRTILTLCAAPRSVAELAALLSMPLGVVRVLLGDMAEAGSVAVHRTAGSADAAPDLDLMQRVLNGLQRL
ncbi:MAG: DUF742 domain-containing protein [Pseudonocardiaceae bacterium]